MLDSSLVKILRALAYLFAEPQHPRTQSESANSEHNHPDHNEIASAINALTEQLEANEKKRNEHDRQVFHTDTRRLRIEKTALAFAVVASVAVIVTLIYVKRSTDASTTAALAAQRSAETAGQQFEATDRPWVKLVELKPRGLQFIGPSFTRKFGTYDQLVVHSTLTIKNIGRSVATQIRAITTPYVPLWKDGWGNQIEPLQRTACESIDPKGPINATLFPDDAYEINQGAQSLLTAANINRDNPNSFVFVLIIGCIDYRFAAAKNSHQTAFVYELFDANKRNRFFPLGTDVPENGLSFIRNTSYDKAN